MLRVPFISLLASAALLGGCADDTTPDANNTGDDVTQGSDVASDSISEPDAITTPDATDASVEPGDTAENDAIDGEDADSDADVESDASEPDPVDGIAGADADAIRAALLDGITALNTGASLLSVLIVTGPNAVAVVVEDNGQPTVGAAQAGEGRIVVVAHEGVLTSGDPGFTRLVQNSGRWLSGAASPAVAWGPGMQAAADLMTDGELVGEGLAALATADVFVTTAYEEWTDEERAQIQAFVQGGGGLLIAGHAWWWAYSGGVDAARNFPGNRVISDWGITISARTMAGDLMPVPERQATDLHHAVRAIDALAADSRGDGPDLTPAQEATAARSAGPAIDELPMEGTFWDQAVDISDEIGGVVPPVSPAEDPLLALALRVQIRQALDADPQDIEAHPAAADFPGTTTVPGTDIVTSVETGYQGYDTRFGYSGASSERWHGLSAWAAAGETVTVSVPSALQNAGYSIQIGAHTDVLWDLEVWERVPRLVQTWPITAGEMEIASGFGGPIYLLEPAGSPEGNHEVSLSNVVRMVRFAPGEMTEEEWAALDWSAYAPWAELEGEHMVLMVPASDAATVTWPLSLTMFWDDVMRGSTWLAGLEQPRTRAERFLVDRQISAGWMHSGYPVMAHLESASEVLNVRELQRVGAWGPFHEFGHNHQNLDWVLPGTTESSVNLWSVFVSEEVAGVAREDAHPAMTAAERQGRVDDWLAGRDRDWSVWMALETYLQLQEEFGWEPFRAVFQTYLAMDEGERPGDDAEKAQEWIIRMSRAVGRDLTAFHAAWGFPIDDATRAAVSDLPAWTDHPMQVP